MGTRSKLFVFPNIAFIYGQAIYNRVDIFLRVGDWFDLINMYEEEPSDLMV